MNNPYPLVIVPKSGDAQNPKKRMTAPKPNTHIPDAVWRMIQQSGSMAAERMARILASPNFHRLPMKDQLRAISLAHDQAYRPATPSTLELKMGQNASNDEMNALKVLAEKALALPELSKKSADK